MTTTSDNDSGLLVIGYGSPLRGDDAAGFRVAEELDGEEGLTCLAVHQLTPDLAIRLSAFSEVVFVDAVAADPIHGLRITPITASSEVTMSSHGCSPESLLDLTEALYGRRPVATLIGIPSVSFDLSETVSESTRLGMDAAKNMIRERCFHHA